MKQGFSTRSRSHSHHLYIDCARGYAVLMVIACHLAYEYPGLPWPVKRVVVSGWFGVQLFFLASCLTLLMSWHAEISKFGKVSLTEFFIRRFFRIAPAYYAAGLFYYWTSPPKGGLNVWHVLETVVFINAWNPAWTPTVQGGWAVVPGGWSISVEFAFYLIFPVFAWFVVSFSRSLQVVMLCLALGVIADLSTLELFRGKFSLEALNNFLFFWFPNQASVFALGGTMFFIIRLELPARFEVARHSNTVAFLSIFVFCALPYLPLGHYLGDYPFVPAGLASCLPLMMFLFALSVGNCAFVNKIAGAIGQVSFSAYLLHFAVLRLLGSFPELFHTGTTAVLAILAYFCGFVAAVAITYVASLLSYRVIEQPMIWLGKHLIHCLHQRVRVG